MDSRLSLHDELLKFHPNVYFQPPSNHTMVYPCIVYRYSGLHVGYANDYTYRTKQEYQITVINRRADSTVPMDMVKHFRGAQIVDYFTIDNLNHAVLTLHY